MTPEQEADFNQYMDKVEADLRQPARIGQGCQAHPDVGDHEPMREEMRCVYCGQRLEPYNCHGCGKFLSLDELHEYETRCKDCA